MGTATMMDKQYVWGIRYVDELVCRDDATPQRLYACQDANFNLTAIIGTSGSVVERYMFDPYGVRTIMSAPWSVLSTSSYSWVIGHQGLVHDGESGLIYNRRRFTTPGAGVFLARDPVGYRGALNLYEYEHGAPNLHRDPKGLYVVCCRAAKGFPDNLVTHCQLYPKVCPHGDTPYPAVHDPSPTRTLLGCDSNKPCNQATSADIDACVKRHPYAATPLPTGAGFCSIGKGEIGNNCQTSTLQTLSSCCLRTHWHPSWYSGSNAPCLSGHWNITYSEPEGTSFEWVCDVTGPDPIF